MSPAATRWTAARYDLFLAAAGLGLALPGHAWRLLWARRVVRMSVGTRSVIARGVRITSKGGVTIGERTNVNGGVLLDGRGGLTIGSRVNVSPEALLLSADHDLRSPSFAGRDRPTVIGDRVWIATRAVVLPGSSVGEGAVIAAGAVVRGIVAPWTVMAGNPAQPVAIRPDSAQQSLIEYRRWLQ